MTLAGTEREPSRFKKALRYRKVPMLHVSRLCHRKSTSSR
jgi:hypothetical protein